MVRQSNREDLSTGLHKPLRATAAPNPGRSRNPFPRSDGVLHHQFVTASPARTPDIRSTCKQVVVEDPVIVAAGWIASASSATRKLSRRGSRRSVVMSANRTAGLE